MLVNLHVKNLAIIDEIEVDFSDKLNVLTGETGAGKSIIIDSINLALGGKIARDMIRRGEDYALVELVFTVDAEQKHALEEMGILVPEDELLISRKLTPSRSINRINGEGATLAAIRQAASLLLDIHGQNEQQSLLHKAKHMEILDSYAREALGQLPEELAESYRRYQRLLEDRQQEALPEEERLREISFIEYELEEIQSVGVKEGEEERLSEEYRRLSNAAQIAQGLGEVYAMTGQASPNVAEQLDHSLRILHRLSEYDELLAGLASQLSELDDLVADFNRELRSYMEDFDAEDDRLVQVEQRLEQVRRIQAKYGNTTDQIRDYARGLQEKLERYQQYEEYQRRLEEEIQATREQLQGLADQITQIRQQKAAVLQEEIIKALQDLNFLQVQFEIAVRPLEEFNIHGKDEVEFMLSVNPGEEKKPMGQAASGGELSRIMLAVKAVLARHDAVPTLIFDEIDVGISGRTAQRVAEKMAHIARLHQVICISHLAQIAAMADAHYLIEKREEEERTSTQIRLLRGEEPVQELARILGGAQITRAVTESAREMKNLADEWKNQY